MAPNTVYLVTGGNRGIGFGLTGALLLRPNTTVIATVRTDKTSKDTLLALPLAEGSNLIITYLDVDVVKTQYESLERSTQEVYRALTTAYKVTKIDTIICNAGIGSSFRPSLSTTYSSLLTHFQVNTLGPISLFQSLYPLLSPNSKFILISSVLGSIGAMDGQEPSLAYGVSKAGANYFVRKVHFENEGVTTLAVHPGWVKTENGQNFADSIGVEEPPMSLEDSVKGVLEQIDAATKSTTSGSFVSYDGTVIPW
ncbi:Norsolorinic acid ketoreductase [Lachnellula suecica]|uniref:Norsolorinic acid ketoreductase n=1 Tax=Lachnellula suecica TaxID=602035 RepID=A0A8T9CD29_9HELO|nr:Norsolorinic acid ketoreductase [Lachnellula suecica]